MKNLVKKVVLIVLTSAWVTWSVSVANAKSEVNVTVSGMVCAFCSNTIEKSFKDKEEVAEVRVDMDTKNIHIVFKDTKNLSDEEIKKIVTDAGYTVVEVKR